jgi:putative inorganic carbon (hco3(-)) transporter
MFRLESLRKNIGIIVLVLVYIVADMILSYRDTYYLNLLPVVVFIVYLALVRIDILYFIVVFLTPISIQLIDYLPSSPIDFDIPTEPLLFGILLLFIYRLVRERNLDTRILNHPVTYAILFHLFWIFLTSVSSSMPVVSFKFLLARTWFLTTFYFLAINIFRKTENITTFIWCYAIPMLFVILYAINRHLGYGLFDKQAAHMVMTPFFRDHTSYGAILAMLFFAIGGIIMHFGSNIVTRFIYWGTMILIIAAIVLSFTRAAWISILISFVVLIIALLKIKLRYVMMAGMLVVFYFIGQRVVLIQKMESNHTESSAKLSDHLKSISNISTDESNRERLNRWSSAFRMFEERPVFGWGPGTYMFKYAPFQLAKNKTSISTDFGDLGNAHSEYIGPLAEQGVLGSLSFILIAIFSLITGFKVYRELKDKRLKQIVLGLILGLITYLVHGSLNNFLDTDKASALFWGFIAVFVSLDIFYIPNQEPKESLQGGSSK